MRAVVVLLAMAVPAQAAVLRPETILSAPVVKLSDLFDDAGARAGTVLGPAPKPGERIVVEAGQLAAIARQFGVDWRPASPGDRAVLEQPGRPLPREPLMQALKAALVRAGASADDEIDLSGFEPPLIPLLANPVVAVEQLDFDRASGRFTAPLRVDGSAMAPLRFAVSGRLEPGMTVVVPVRALTAGTVLRPADLTLARVRASAVRGEVLGAVAQAEGLLLHRPAPQGQPLVAADLSRPAAVAKGTRVVMEVKAPGLQVVVQGVAMEAGALGEVIQVLNPASHMIVEGEVTGSGRVVVQAGTVPVEAGSQVAAR